MTHTLHHGDCLDILPTLADRSVDAIIADPPYGTTACKWDSVIPFEPMWAQLKRIIKPRGAIVLFGSQPFTSALVMSNPKWYRHSWVWDKKRVTGGANADHAPMKAHEDIIVFSKYTTCYNPQVTQWSEDQIKRKRRHDFFVIASTPMQHRDNIAPGRDKQILHGRHPDTVIRIHALGSIDPERTGHTTQKPLALLEYLVKTYTHAGNTVLDFTMGSGTTGEACITTGRHFIGIEKEQTYYDIAAKRLETAAARMVQMELAV